MLGKQIVAVMFMFVTSAACSTLPRGEAHHAGSVGADIRGDSSVRVRRARALVSGPAIVKHLETNGEGTLTLYLTDDPGIGDRACASAAAEQSSPVAILKQQSGITDLVVPDGKRVCASVAEARSMNVSWHARSTFDQERSLELALLLSGASR